MIKSTPTSKDSAILTVAQITNGSVRLPSKTLGGNESNIYNLCRELKSVGVNSFAVDNCYSEYQDFPGMQTDGVIDILRVRTYARSLSLSGSDILYRISRLLTRTIYMVSAAFNLRRINVDLIHCYDFTSVFITALFLPSKKIVYTHTSSHWPNNFGGVWNILLKGFFGILLRFSDSIIVPNQFVADSLVLAGVKKTKIHLIPPGVGIPKVSQYSLSSGQEAAPFVLFVGRVNREKGVDSLLQAADYIVNELSRRDFRLIIAGPLEEFDKDHEPTIFLSQLKEFIRQKNLVFHIRMLGMVSPNHLAFLYRKCVCLALPSRFEAYGQVISEAFLFGRPVVATSTPGAIMQVSEGIDGFLVPIDDYRALANNILKLIDNPQLANQFGENGRKLSQNRLWSTVSRKYLLVYEETNRTCLSRVQS